MSRSAQRTHVLGVDADAPVGDLVSAVAESGARVGRLVLRPPDGVDAGLEAALAEGAFRAVAVGGGVSQSVKALRGEAVMKDLLREHFRGCVLVLVTGSQGLPELTPAGAGWAIETPSGHRTEWTTSKLVASLRRPAPGWLEPA